MGTEIFKCGQMWLSPDGTQYEVVDVLRHATLPAMAKLQNPVACYPFYWEATEVDGWLLEKDK